jgi:hypothetical protein
MICLAKTVELGQTEYCIIPVIPVVSMATDKETIVRDSRSILSYHDIAYGPESETFINKRIAVYGGVTVRHCSLIISEIILGYCSQVVGLIKVGLSLDGLIEILDGQSVVLVI